MPQAKTVEPPNGEHDGDHYAETSPLSPAELAGLRERLATYPQPLDPEHADNVTAAAAGEGTDSATVLGWVEQIWAWLTSGAVRVRIDRTGDKPRAVFEPTTREATIDMPTIAVLTGLTPNMVRKMRSKGDKEGQEPGRDALPKTDLVSGQSPVWPVDDFLRYLRGIGRMNNIGVTTRLTSPGPAPRQRDWTAADQK